MPPLERVLIRRKRLQETDCPLLWLRDDKPLRRHISCGRKHRARLVAQPPQLALPDTIMLRKYYQRLGPDCSLNRDPAVYYAQPMFVTSDSTD